MATQDLMRSCKTIEIKNINFSVRISCTCQFAYEDGVSYERMLYFYRFQHPDSKVHGANMGPISGPQDPGRSHVGPMNFAIWYTSSIDIYGMQ